MLIVLYILTTLVIVLPLLASLVEWEGRNVSGANGLILLVTCGVSLLLSFACFAIAWHLYPLLKALGLGAGLIAWPLLCLSFIPKLLVWLYKKNKTS